MSGPRLLLAILLVGGIARAQNVGEFIESGAGCPQPRPETFYETFAGGTFDLDGLTIGFVPGGSGGYSVVPGFVPKPFGGPSSLPTFSGDDTIRGPFFLGFPFPYIGGQTIAVDIASNGYVYLEPSSIANPRCCDGFGSLNAFLMETPSIAGLGTDLNVTLGGQIWWDVDETCAWITWDDVVEEGGQAGNTFQIQLHSDGSIVIAWIQCPISARSALIGYSDGNGAMNNGPRDFSKDLPLLFTGPFGDPVTLRSFDIPTLGSSVDVEISNLPMSTTVATMLFGTAIQDLDLTVIGATTCRLLHNASIGSIPIPFTPPDGLLTLNVPNSPGLSGLTFWLQAAVLAPGTTPLGLVTSNRGGLVIGDLPPVTVVADGPNSFNNDTSRGFWRVTNGLGNPDIESLTFDWVGANPPNAQVFDTDQPSMADRFDGGNSTLATCRNTYRNNSDVVTGLVYNGTAISACDPTAQTGWIGSNPQVIANDWRTLEFSFTDFNGGETFEMDIDTDNGGSSGGSMASMVVSVMFADGSFRSGVLEFVNTDLSIARF